MIYIYIHIHVYACLIIHVFTVCDTKPSPAIQRPGHCADHWDEASAVSPSAPEDTHSMSTDVEFWGLTNQILIKYSNPNVNQC